MMAPRHLSMAILCYLAFGCRLDTIRAGIWEDVHLLDGYEEQGPGSDWESIAAHFITDEMDLQAEKSRVTAPFASPSAEDQQLYNRDFPISQTASSPKKRQREVGSEEDSPLPKRSSSTRQEAVIDGKYSWKGGHRMNPIDLDVLTQRTHHWPGLVEQIEEVGINASQIRTKVSESPSGRSYAIRRKVEAPCNIDSSAKTTTRGEEITYKSSVFGEISQDVASADREFDLHISPQVERLRNFSTSVDSQDPNLKLDEPILTSGKLSENRENIWPTFRPIIVQGAHFHTFNSSFKKQNSVQPVSSETHLPHKMSSREQRATPFLRSKESVDVSPGIAPRPAYSVQRTIQHPASQNNFASTQVQQVSLSGEQLKQLLLMAMATNNVKAALGILRTAQNASIRLNVDDLLSRALHAPDRSMVKLFLQHGANPQHFLSTTGYSLLYDAVMNGDEDYVKLLLHKGADPTEQGRHPLNPLQLALRLKRNNLLRLMQTHALTAARQTNIP